MPIKYIGRTTNFEGKTLWEIVGNLKHFGVGRIIVRHTQQRYPEPTFMKIVKVEPDMEPEVVSMDRFRKVHVWVERVFRGRKQPSLTQIFRVSYKPDYKLIPKEEEAAICRLHEVKPMEKERILPPTIEFPPLLKEMIMREQAARGTPVDEKEVRLPVFYRDKKHKKSRKAKDEETPNVEIPSRLGTPVSPRLYENVLQ